jgi:hypothetical protein
MDLPAPFTMRVTQFDDEQPNHHSLSLTAPQGYKLVIMCWPDDVCHAGPCPPCPLLIDAPCFCGHKVEKRRCGRHHWSCGGQ